MHYLYRITNRLNGKIYIGQTVDDKRRWIAHQSYAKNPERTGQYIHRSMSKYGIENFTYEVIDFAFNRWQADCLEENYIQRYESRDKNKGYNRAPGGNVAWQSGLPPEAYPMYGKHHTEKSRRQIGVKQLGKVNDEVSKLKMSASAKLRKPVQNRMRKGIKHMSYEMAESIRAEYTNGGISFSQLSKKYDRSIATISNIINQKSWTNK